MKVTFKGKQEELVPYCDIKQGQSFLIYEEVYIKTDRKGVRGITCVNLKTGSTYSYADDRRVKPLKVEVVVYD